jgi:hypothetical protein
MLNNFFVSFTFIDIYFSLILIKIRIVQKIHRRRIEECLKLRQIIGLIIVALFYYYSASIIFQT